jgi:hypothetical protein
VSGTVEEHFTAHLKIERVRKTTPTVSSYDRRVSAQEPSTREVVEVLVLTVRDDTLNGLQSKIRRHLAVSDEPEAAS